MEREGREDRPRALTSGQAAQSKAVALAGAVAVVAGARGMTPWARSTALPTIAYPKVFVVGCPRSGTTWVNTILEGHPRVVGGRESHLYPTICGLMATQGRFSVKAWARLLYGVERGARLGRGAGVHNYVDRPTLARLGRGVLAEARSDDEAADRLIRAVLDSHFSNARGTSDDVLVEKTPFHIFHAERILSTFPEARLVEVVRDGRDVCVSMQMRAQRVPAFPTSREGQIDLWVRSVRHGLAVRRNPDFRDRVTVVRYEDLKADTVVETKRLFTAVGLDAPAELVAGAVDATDVSRLRTGPGEFHHRGEVGTWVDHFSADDERQFHARVGDLFTQIGYAYD